MLTGSRTRDGPHPANRTYATTHSRTNIHTKNMQLQRVLSACRRRLTIAVPHGKSSLENLRWPVRSRLNRLKNCVLKSAVLMHFQPWATAGAKQSRWLRNCVFTAYSTSSAKTGPTITAAETATLTTKSSKNPKKRKQTIESTCFHAAKPIDPIRRPNTNAWRHRGVRKYRRGASAAGGSINKKIE